MAELHVEVVSVESEVWSGEAVTVIAKTTEGEIGILPGHAPLLGELAEGSTLRIMQAGEGLHPSAKGARVKFSGTKRTVIDGPFAETKELIAGYWMWQVKSMGEAIEWVKRCPNPFDTDSEIEIRQVFEADDFGAEFTPELREQEERLRAQMAVKK